ncbi:MAG TPA: helix-turn-helix domain-containing protein, partial [Mycobacterium sp.]|nr:helix-turn-helix domain-containing protein [Mycobacterium sp.]
MLSISNASVEVRILAAAASCVIDFGVERVTLAEIARRAGVSRPTVYRRWPDTRSVLAALLTSHITAALDDVPVRG